MERLRYLEPVYKVRLLMIEWWLAPQARNVNINTDFIDRIYLFLAPGSFGEHAGETPALPCHCFLKMTTFFNAAVNENERFKSTNQQITNLM